MYIHIHILRYRRTGRTGSTLTGLLLSGQYLREAQPEQVLKLPSAADFLGSLACYTDMNAGICSFRLGL